MCEGGDGPVAVGNRVKSQVIVSTVGLRLINNEIFDNVGTDHNFVVGHVGWLQSLTVQDLE